MNSLRIKNRDIHNKRVFVRADLNVPLKNNVITNDFRLKALLPTLLYLRASHAKIIIGTHIGKPEADKIDDSLSTRHLVDWFNQQNFSIDFEPDLSVAQAKSSSSFDTILLLENLRFFTGEKSKDRGFAKQLASMADIYINDAFGTIHRTDTSVTLLPQQFESHNRGIGLLIEKEITELEYLKQEPEQPFMLVLGGAKLDDKIPLLTNFIQAPHTQRVHTIMVGGALAFPFLTARGGNAIGITQCKDQTVVKAQEIGELCKQQSIPLLLPVDLMYIQGPLGSTPHSTDISHIPNDAQCIDIGPQTIDLFSQTIAQAKTIFTNGTMGMFEYPAYQPGTQSILAAIATINGHTVVGGGDTVSAVEQCKLNHSFGFLSSGGGATLAYLGTRNPWLELPGLTALL